MSEGDEEEGEGADGQTEVAHRMDLDDADVGEPKLGTYHLCGSTRY